MSVPLPPENIWVPKVFSHFIDANKTFQSKEGTKQKFVLHFADGYFAEYCPLVGISHPSSIGQGQKININVFHRSNKGDEIKIYLGDKDMPEVIPTSVNKGNNMNGHPASLALHIAKDIYIAKIAKLPNYKDIDDMESGLPGLSSIMEDAELLYGFLKRISVE